MASKPRVLLLPWRAHFRRHFGSPSRVRVALASLFLLAASGSLLPLDRPVGEAAGPVTPIQVGASFDPEQVEWLGLDYRTVFRQLEGMGFRVIRVSAKWRQVDAEGYDKLDWLLTEAAANQQPVVLTVGMKAMGWPEFHVPELYQPAAIDPGHDVSTDRELAEATLRFVSQTIDRYRGNPALVAWQVENEPFNPAGPNRWWIGPSLVAQEIQLIRQVDARPIIVNAFSHFNVAFDVASNRDALNLGSVLGFDSVSAAADALAVLPPGGILGLDAYTRIGYSLFGHPVVADAGSDWPHNLRKWSETARAAGKSAWITEFQAEPWEATTEAYLNAPRSLTSGDFAHNFQQLRSAGFSKVILWGSGYWFYRAAQGDPQWLNAVRKVLRAESKATAISLWSQPSASARD